MKIKILEENSFIFKTLFNKETIEESAKISLDFENDSFVLKEDLKTAAVLISGFCYMEEFSKKLIFYEITKDGKKIIFEIIESNFELEEIKKLKKWIMKRNKIAVYKSPLNCDNSSIIRESVLNDNEKPANLRGLLNLFILFAVLNYYRLIIEHSLKYGSLFNENLLLFLKMTKSDKNFYIFLILFISYITLIFKIQIWTFQKKVASRITNTIIIITSSIYFLISVLLVIHFELPFCKLKSSGEFSEYFHNDIFNEVYLVFTCFI